MVRLRMKFGDYTVKGLEKYIRIERKHGWSELLSNMSTKRSKERLWKNLEQLGRVNQNGGVAAVFVEDNPVNLSTAACNFSNVGLDFRSILFLESKALLEFGVPIIPIGRGIVKEAFVKQFFDHFVATHKAGTTWYKKG